MNLQLKASKSYWTSRRDEQFSLLDILLNGKSGSESAEEIQDKINSVVGEIALCIKAIEVVENLIQYNEVPDDNLKNEEQK